MKEEKPIKKGDPDSFGPLMRQMNDFFTQKPVKRLLESIDEFFDKPFPFSTLPIDMYETENELVISADLPGVRREQIQIDYATTSLTITVHHSEEMEEKNETKQYYVKKNSFNRTTRTITLPYPITNGNVKASYRDGVLKIRIPKQKKKRIMIEE